MQNPQAESPRSRPTGEAFDTDTEPYADGFADVPTPEWLKQAAADQAQKRWNVAEALKYMGASDARLILDEGGLTPGRSQAIRAEEKRDQEYLGRLTQPRRPRRRTF